MITFEDVAIKLEPLKSKHPQLLYESKLYKILHGGSEFIDDSHSWQRVYVINQSEYQ